MKSLHEIASPLDALALCRKEPPAPGALRNILLYTHALSGGGAERVWTLLASGLRQYGYNVLLAVDFEATQNQPFLDPRVNLIVLGGGHILSTLRLARLIRRVKPDVTLSALSISNLKHFIAAALTGRPDRTILSYHGYAESEPQLLSRLSYRLTPVMTRLTGATVCVSDGLRRYLVRVWKAHRHKTHRVYNPVDGGPLPPAASVSDLKARGPVILAAGRMVSYKNFPLLIRAFAQVEPKDARLIILGDGVERSVIKAEIARLGLDDRVELPGYVDEPWTYFAQARCFVLSSDFESFGLVLVEAMANGLPIVSTDCDGPREILGDGRHGRLVPPRNEKALARALTEALADPDDPAGRIARARIFSRDAGVEQYRALIEAVLLRPKSGTAR